MGLLELSVNYHRSERFEELVKKEGATIENIYEFISQDLLIYHINCDDEKEAIITEYGFMSWIKNPKFLKHY